MAVPENVSPAHAASTDPMIIIQPPPRAEPQ